MSGLRASGLKTRKQGEFELHWQGTLSDYVTAIAWSPDGKMAASSAAGEVVLYQAGAFQETSLQQGDGRSVDCLAWSQDGQFLAAGGQSGQVNIWQVQSDRTELIATVGNPSAWVDRMAWSPTQNLWLCRKYFLMTNEVSHSRSVKHSFRRVLR